MLYKEGEHMENQVRDLRSALKLLKEIPGQLVETDVEVNPRQSWLEFTVMWELAGL